jgi:CheY-like chemotaxis protein
MARILVVDDHKDFRDAVRIFLEREGHHVMDTGSGADAVQLCRDHRPDLVILDIYVPGKNGIEALWQIRNERLARKVLVVSGGRDRRLSGEHLGSSTVLGLARNLGADGVLAKPVEPDALLSAVDSALAV